MLSVTEISAYLITIMRFEEVVLFLFKYTRLFIDARKELLLPLGHGHYSRRMASAEC